MTVGQYPGCGRSFQSTRRHRRLHVDDIALLLVVMIIYMQCKHSSKKTKVAALVSQLVKGDNEFCKTVPG